VIVSSYDEYFPPEETKDSTCSGNQGVTVMDFNDVELSKQKTDIDEDE